MLQTTPSPARSTAPLLYALAGAALAGLTGTAFAAEPRFLGTFRDWNAYVLDEPKGPACWIASKPKRQEGEFTKRGDVFLLVTQRPGEKALDVVSVVAGYTYAEGTEATVTTGGGSFALFTEADTAWARDDATDRAIAKAIRSGTTLTVKGTSSRGTRTVDTFSLAGSDSAYQAAAAACGLAPG